MAKKKLKPREFLTDDHRAEIEREIKALEKQLTGDGSSDVGFMKHAVDHIQDPDDIKRQISKHKQHLKDGTPRPFKTTRQRIRRLVCNSRKGRV